MENNVVMLKNNIMKTFIFNTTLVHVSRTWERIRVEQPHQEMPYDNIESVDEIVSLAEEISEDDKVNMYFNQTMNYSSEEVFGMMFDSYVETRAEKKILELLARGGNYCFVLKDEVGQTISVILDGESLSDRIGQAIRDYYLVGDLEIGDIREDSLRRLSFDPDYCYEIDVDVTEDSRKLSYSHTLTIEKQTFY